MTQLLVVVCFIAYVLCIYISALLGSLLAAACFFPARDSQAKAQIWLRSSVEVEPQARFVSCIGAIPIAIFALTFSSGLMCSVGLGCLAGLLLTWSYGSKIRL